MLEQYKQHLVSQGKSPNTIESYIRNLNAFFKFSPELTRTNVLDYKATLTQNAKTINQILSSIKSYNEYLISNNIIQNMTVLSQDYITIQQSNSNPTDITYNDVKKFMDKIKNAKHRYAYRNYAIVVSLANTGMRISELLNLKLNNYKEEITIIGKGNKQRNIQLNDTMMNIIDLYIRNRNSNSPYLFVSQNGDKLDRSTINAIFNEHSKKITPHKLRHYFATSYLANGGNIRQLQELLGHTSLNTTSIYTHPLKSQIKKTVKLVSIS